MMNDSDQGNIFLSERNHPENLHKIILELSGLKDENSFLKAVTQKIGEITAFCIDSVFVFKRTDRLEFKNEHGINSLLQNAILLNNDIIFQAMNTQEDLYLPLQEVILKYRGEEGLFVFPFLARDAGAFLILTKGKLDKHTGADLIKSYARMAIIFYKELCSKKTVNDINEKLKISESSVISSEKLATLGQLTAGVIHEINSPIGVVRASAGNIKEAKEKILQDLPAVFSQITPSNISPLLQLISLAWGSKETLSSREERARKRELVNALTQNDIENSEAIADVLVDMGIYQDVSPLLKQLGEHMTLYLSFAYNLAAIERNNQNILCAIEPATKLILALKNFTHLQQQSMVLENIAAGVDTVLTLYQHSLKQNINVIKNYNPIPPTLCFQDELQQVWSNLIQNAIQAMNSQGTLEISIGRDNNDIVVSFADTGSGISNEIRGKIFNPFFTTKPQGEGSGLGLDIAKRIVEKHAGRIDFESTPGKTIFTVRIPIQNKVET